MARWSSPGIAQVAELVRTRTGLVFPDARRADVEATIRRAMHRRGLQDPQRLLDVLRKDTRAREALVAELTIGESYFLRDAAQFQLLRDRILPELLAASRDTPIRLWSAGCAAGEEPYTMAMLLEELGAAQRAHIVGSDLARPRLEDAQRGLYSRWALRGMSDAVRERYFTARGRYFELTPRIRQRVEFLYLNLADDTFPSLTTGIWGMDVIFCRNVLIYFDRPTIERVARRLINSLSSDGWLVLAASDPPIGELVECDVVLTDAGLVYRRPGHAPARAAPQRTASLREGSPPPELPVEPSAEIVLPEPVPEPLPVDTSASAFDAPAAEPDTPSDDDVVAAYAARDFDRVRALAQRIADRRVPGERVWSAWVRALANQGCIEDAATVAARAIDTAVSAELLYLHAVLLLQVGRTADAAAAARRALYVDRDLIVAHITLAEAQRRAGNVDGARRSLRNAESLLARQAPDALVPASDGESAGRLSELVRANLRLLEHEPSRRA